MHLNFAYNLCKLCPFVALAFNFIQVTALGVFKSTEFTTVSFQTDFEETSVTTNCSHMASELLKTQNRKERGKRGGQLANLQHI